MPSSELELRRGVAGGEPTRRRGVRWTSRGRRVALVTLVAGSLALAVGVPAQADPTPSAGDVSRAQQAAQAAAGDVGRMQAKLAKAQAQLKALTDDAERAVEAYNGARYELGQAKTAAQAARARAAAAAADLAEAEREVGRFASASYRMGGGLGSFASMLDANGLQDLMNQATDLANVAASNNRALDRVAAARIVADRPQPPGERRPRDPDRSGGARTARQGRGRGQGRRPDRPDRRAREAHPQADAAARAGARQGRVALAAAQGGPRGAGGAREGRA